MMDKFSQAAGELQLRDQRRLDAEPARPTPKKYIRPKPIRPFGYSFERKRWRFGAQGHVWVRKFIWLDTETARDQAFAVAVKRAVEWERSFKKEQR